MIALRRALLLVTVASTVTVPLRAQSPEPASPKPEPNVGSTGDVGDVPPADAAPARGAGTPVAPSKPEATQPPETTPAELAEPRTASDEVGEAGRTPTPTVDATPPDQVEPEPSPNPDRWAATDLDSICAIDPAACLSLDLEAEAAKDLNEQIYAVQPIYAKRKRRVELLVFASTTLNDQFVLHPGPGFGASYFAAETIAIGATFNFYRPFNCNSDFNQDTRRAARVAIPLSEYAWGASAGITHVPAYGKFAGVGDFIFHWDIFLSGGLGVIYTRPIPVIDPENRSFDFTPKLAGHGGIGARIFFNRWLASVLELRDYVFEEHLENRATPINRARAADRDTWYGDREVVNDLQLQLGVAVFVPFSVKYTLPR
ncbi:MAG: outer membrane beta-barrel domain-containing protein [Polyangiaceae bacterium]|nr:outer membrane beta-barrel domain-containing protein [Polyangiaceae bacterium]